MITIVALWLTEMFTAIGIAPILYHTVSAKVDAIDQLLQQSVSRPSSAALLTRIMFQFWAFTKTNSDMIIFGETIGHWRYQIPNLPSIKTPQVFELGLSNWLPGEVNSDLVEVRWIWLKALTKGTTKNDGPT